jgi:SAM-dependent methyltransferase
MEFEQENRTHHVAQGSMGFLPNYFRWTYSFYSSSVAGIVLELGVGAGLGLKYYLKRVDQIIAVDHNETLLANLQSMTDSAKVSCVKSDLTGAWMELSDIQADTIIMMDVLEHFSDDVSFLQKAKKHLKPEGRMIIKVPAGPELYGEIDRSSGHYRRYDIETIKSLAGKCGLKLREIEYINRVGGLVYRLRKQKSSSFSGTFRVWQLKIINRLIPFIARIDRLLPEKGGLSVICILEKV